MNCRKFSEALEDYLEGGLDFASRFAIERHVSQCFVCEKRLATALSLRQMAKDLVRLKAPEEFERDLLIRIREEKSRHRFAGLLDWWRHGVDGFSWRATAVTALVTLLAVGGATYWYFGARSVQPLQARSVPSSAVLKSAGPVDSMDATRIALSKMGISDLDVVQFDGLSQNRWVTPYMDPADEDFVEVPVQVSRDVQLILKLPKTIRMRYGQPSREYFIRTASH